MKAIGSRIYKNYAENSKYHWHLAKLVVVFTLGHTIAATLSTAWERSPYAVHTGSVSPVTAQLRRLLGVIPEAFRHNIGFDIPGYILPGVCRQNSMHRSLITQFALQMTHGC